MYPHVTRMLLVVLVWRCFSNDRRFAPPKNNGGEKRQSEILPRSQAMCTAVQTAQKRDIPNKSWLSFQN